MLLVCVSVFYCKTNFLIKTKISQTTHNWLAKICMKLAFVSSSYNSVFIRKKRLFIVCLLFFPSDSNEVAPRKRTFSSRSKVKEAKTVAAKKKKAAPRSEESLEPLNTGLSLAEDEELVLHLLNSRS